MSALYDCKHGFWQGGEPPLPECSRCVAEERDTLRTQLNEVYGKAPPQLPPSFLSDPSAMVVAEAVRLAAAVAVEDTDIEISGRGYMREDDGQATLYSAARNVLALDLPKIIASLGTKPEPCQEGGDG